MPGVPARQVTIAGETAPRLGALWSFPGTTASLIVDKVPQLRLPHLSSAFGLLEDATLFLNGVEIGPLDAQGAYCGGDGIEYVIDLPQLPTYPPGIVTGEIQASMLAGTPVSKVFEIDVRPGPTWLNQPGNDYANRVILWRPEQVTLTADEPEHEKTAHESGIDYGVGDLMNDNRTSASVSHVLLPSGADFRKRFGKSNSMVASENADEVEKSASGNGSSASNPVPFGSMDPITVLDTGKIPLFRYAWGLWPIASATVSANIWFEALYRYFGEIVATNALALAFSKATEPDAFIGTRRSLHTAFGTQCFAGICNFDSAAERTDSPGRRIFVDAVYDPSSNAVLTTAVQVGQSTTFQAQASSRNESQALAPQGLGGSPVLLAEKPMLPDFELVDAQLAQPWIAEGSSVELSLTVRNNGTPWSTRSARSRSLTPATMPLCSM